MIDAKTPAGRSIGVSELQRRLAAGEPALLLDVRTPGEHAAVHVPGAKLIPLDELDAAVLCRERGADGRRFMCCASPVAARRRPLRNWSMRACRAVFSWKAARRRGLTPGCP